MLKDKSNSGLHCIHWFSDMVRRANLDLLGLHCIHWFSDMVRRANLDLLDYNSVFSLCCQLSKSLFFVLDPDPRGVQVTPGFLKFIYQ